jgi:hypothetical protein
MDFADSNDFDRNVCEKSVFSQKLILGKECHDTVFVPQYGRSEAPRAVNFCLPTQLAKKFFRKISRKIFLMILPSPVG